MEGQYAHGPQRTTATSVIGRAPTPKAMIIVRNFSLRGGHVTTTTAPITLRARSRSCIASPTRLGPRLDYGRILEGNPRSGCLSTAGLGLDAVPLFGTSFRSINVRHLLSLALVS